MVVVFLRRAVLLPQRHPVLQKVPQFRIAAGKGVKQRQRNPWAVRNHDLVIGVEQRVGCSALGTDQQRVRRVGGRFKKLLVAGQFHILRVRQSFAPAIHQRVTDIHIANSQTTDLSHRFHRFEVAHAVVRHDHRECDVHVGLRVLHQLRTFECSHESRHDHVKMVVLQLLDQRRTLERNKLDLHTQVASQLVGHTDVVADEVSIAVEIGEG